VGVVVGGEGDDGGREHDLVDLFHIRIVAQNTKLTRMEVNVKLIFGLNSVLFVVDIKQKGRLLL
jgi:hypothetical protein